MLAKLASGNGLLRSYQVASSFLHSKVWREGPHRNEVLVSGLTRTLIHNRVPTYDLTQCKDSEKSKALLRRYLVKEMLGLGS